MSGGKRPNAGRPKAENSKLMRIPLGLVDQIEEQIKIYRDLNKKTKYLKKPIQENI